MRNQAIFIFLLFVLSFTNLQAQEFVSIEKLITDTTVQTKILPISSITSALEETNKKIQEIDQKATPPKSIASMDSVISVYKVKTDSINQLMNKELNETSDFVDVERKIIELEKYKDKLTEYNELLQREINKLEQEFDKIQQYARIWEDTRSAEGYSEVSQAIRTEIDTLILKINDSQKELHDLSNIYLEKQLTINNQLSLIQELLEKINLQWAEQNRNLFTRSAPPLWDLLRLKGDDENLENSFENLIQLRRRDIHDYYGNNQTRIYLALLYLAVIQAFFFYLKYQINKTEFEKGLDRYQNVALRLLRLNWSSGLVFGLMIVYFTLPDKPEVINTLLFLISLIPLYFLVANIVEKKYHYLIRMLFLIFLITLIMEPIEEVAIFRRFFLMSLNLLALIWLIFLLRKNWYRIFSLNFIAVSSKLISQIFVLFLIISLAANIWGSFRFSIYVTYAVSASLFYGLLLYLLYLILIGIITAFFFIKSSSQLRIVRKFKVEMERKISAALRLILILIYVGLMLRSFRVIEDVFQFFMGIIEHPYHIGNFTFAIGDILLFVIVILISRWIARFIVFILDEQILYKPGSKKDLVASASSLVKFSIITFGVLIGLIAIGFEMDKLTILISAFGVGIGFGLQNIFNNLVSGIIMVFEQPLQVGDVIQVGTMTGTVKKIGIRSSVIRTFDGSEVIVPNGNLISNELVNWTHSDMQRRLTIKVSVAYGTDPQNVIDILLSVVNKKDTILKSPNPYVLFTEFGDYALNFELRCWTDDFDNWIFVASDLHVEVNNALKQAGITIPFPQRDVNLYQGDLEVKDTSQQKNKK